MNLQYNTIQIFCAPTPDYGQNLPSEYINTNAGISYKLVALATILIVGAVRLTTPTVNCKVSIASNQPTWMYYVPC